MKNQLKTKSKSWTANIAAAQNAVKAGCPVFPCRPTDKSPYVKWQSAATTDSEEVIRLWERFPDAVPGLVTGILSGLAVIDLDIKNGKNGVEAFKMLGFSLDEAGAVVQTAGGGLHLYYEQVDGSRNAQDKNAPGIDVRAEGGYVIAPGAVTNAGAYRFKSGDLDTVRLLGLQLPELFLPNKKLTQLQDKSLLVDPEEIRTALSHIPNNENYDSWMRIIMACKDGFSGSKQGLKVVQEWCAGYPGYEPIQVERMWSSINTEREGGVTVATLFSEAKKYGWHRSNDHLFDDDPVPDCDELDAVGARVHKDIRQLNDRFAMVRMGSKVVIAEFKQNGDIDFLATGSFRELLGNRRYGRKTLGAAWLAHPARRTYEGGLEFKPEGVVPSDTLNLWTGWDLISDSSSDCSLIIDHVKNVVASGVVEHANYIFSWLADIIQNPSEKPGVALVLKGKKGVGKDTVADIMKKIVGRRHSAHVPATDRLTGRFNSAFGTAILIHVEEAIWGGQRESKGVVQSLITSPEMPLERKNVDTVQIDSFCRLLFTTNEAWAVPATADERRYAVFEVSACHRNDREYFSALYDQIKNGGLNGFLAFLENWKRPEGVEVRNPPKTKGLMEQKLSGLRGTYRWWYETLCDGTLPFGEADGPDEDWEKAAHVVRKDYLRQAYDDWMHHRRYQGEIMGPAEFGEAIRTLCDGVSSYRPSEDGKRTWKYRFPVLEVCRFSFAIAMGGNEEEISWSS
jgi:hypothetical protein